jgi:hypothetical protein
MALTPTYIRQQSIPQTSGQQMAPLSLASTGVAEAAAGAADVFAKVASTIQTREDVVNRSKDYSNFQTEIGTEWQRVQDEEDLTNPNTISKFNAFLEQKRVEVIGNHVGSADSRADLDAKLTSQAGAFERAAVSTLRSSQIEFLQNQFGDELNPILAGVQDGSIDIDDAFGKVTAIGLDKESGLPKPMFMDMMDSANSAIAMAGINKHLAVGDWPAAKQEIDMNPQFAKYMDVNQMQKVVARIEGQKNATVLAETKAVADRNNKAREWGFKSWSEVPQSWKLFGPQKPETFNPLTEAGKIVAERDQLVRIYGGDQNAPAVVEYDKLRSEKKAMEMASPVGKLIADQSELMKQGIGPGNLAYDTITNKIKAENPEYVAQQERVTLYPSAKISLEAFERQAKSMNENAKNALMLWTGTDSLSDAKKAIADKEFSSWTTGFGVRAAELRGGSAVNEIKVILERIGGSRMLDALAALKASSPSGASGMGALNQTEGNALRFTEGALDIMAPATTTQTLIDLIDGTDSAIINQRKAFYSAFPSLSQDAQGGGGEGSNVVNGGTGGYDLNGNPIGG